MRDRPRAFPTGGVVEADDLVGRDAILADLFERVYRQRNSVVLSAPRQTGKTSVVMELLRRVRRAGGWGVYLDCSVATSEDDLAALVAAATYDEAAGSRDAFTRLADFVKGLPRPVLFQTDADIALAFHSPRANITTTQKLQRALALADQLAAERSKRVVVVYDEFPLLRKLSPKIFDKVRAALQHANARAAYVFMGSEVGVLTELFKSRRRMPFRLGVALELPPPPAADWVTYIERRFRKLGHPLAAGESRQLVEFAGGHPRDLMEVCQRLLTFRTLKEGAPEPADVRLAEEQTLDGLRRHFEDLWNALDEPAGTRVTAVRIATRQRVYARGLAPTQAKRALDKLESEGIVRKVGRGEYAFTEPLFARYVREISARA